MKKPDTFGGVSIEQNYPQVIFLYNENEVFDSSCSFPKIYAGS